MYKIGIVGATGLVGRSMLKILEERNFPVSSLRLFASKKSFGKKLIFKKDKIKVEKLNYKVLRRLDIVLLSAGSSVSKKVCPVIAKGNGVAVDNSSAWRMKKDVPLIVPEVNAFAIKKHKGIIANPNCSTIQLVLVLFPIHTYFSIKRVIVSTYQAVSGKGKGAIDELLTQTQMALNLRNIKSCVFTRQIAFNVIPHIDVFDNEGYTLEEKKITNETKKILNDNNIKVSATAVRVPVFNVHCESVNVETKKKFTIKKVIDILKDAKGIVVSKGNEYNTPVEVSERDECFVSRIRKDDTVKNGMSMWICADNLRKGAALNAVQIAELLIS